MDFACGVRKPSVFHGGEGTYLTFDRLDSHLKTRCRRIGCNFLKNREMIPYEKKKKKVVLSSIGIRMNFEKLNCSLWSCSSSGALVSDFVSGVGTSSKLVPLRCEGSDSVGFVDDNDRNVESDGSDNEESSIEGTGVSLESEFGQEGGFEGATLVELKELLQKALKDLEVARLNTSMFEEKAQRIAEAAMLLKDDAANAFGKIKSTLEVIQEILVEELVAKEDVRKAIMVLSLAEARLQVAVASSEATSGSNDFVGGSKERDSEYGSGEEAFLVAQDYVRECQATLTSCEGALRQLESKKEELQVEIDRLNDLAQQAQLNASKAEEEVVNIMILAEQAVAVELEAAQRADDAEIALQRATKILSTHVDGEQTSMNQNGSSSQGTVSREEQLVKEAKDGQENPISVDNEDNAPIEGVPFFNKALSEGLSKSSITPSLPYQGDQEKGKLSESSRVNTVDSENFGDVPSTKKQDLDKDVTRDSAPYIGPKSLLKKSSRFFSASFFSSDGEEFAPVSVFRSLFESARQQLPKLVVGSLLIGSGIFFYTTRSERIGQLFLQPDVTTTSTDDVSTYVNPLVSQIRKLPMGVKKLMEMLPHQEVNEEEASLFDMFWLLLASVIFVPAFQKIPGGSPVLGYLAAGILIGPYGLSIIRNVHGTKAIAEFGVVFLLFNIGLELSVERLSSMKKYVFGLGSAQVLVTTVVIGLVTHFIAGQPGSAAIVIGNGFALSSTAVVLQVLQERSESTSRHGRATFSVLLFQDLAVVVLLILIPLLSPNSSEGGVGLRAIAYALGLAAVKAVVAITAIMAGGRLLLRPIYKRIAEGKNTEIFSANTLFVILGTSLLTARAGLSMALGAFLAGLLLAETEYHLQIESDIAPYRGLLLGLFFMTVGMSIDPKLLLSNFPVVMGSLGLLIAGKTLLVAIIGQIFGVSIISAIRVGLLLAPGGEFAFVAFGEAVNQGIMSSQLSSLLFLVVGISMALTPWLAAGGQLIANRFELHDVQNLLPVESETDDLQDHIIICGFGRVGQIVAQLLSDRLIPFVALDVRSERVMIGRALDFPVYFGDAGSQEVLHKVGASRASAAAITLDAPGANYRTVWALSKHFPNVKTFARAHDVNHGLNLEKAGATAVVPETFEPSLQLAAAVLAAAKMPQSEITVTINEFRSRHLSELTEVCEETGSCLGYGYFRSVSKPKSQSPDSSDEKEVNEGTLAI